MKNKKAREFFYEFGKVLYRIDAVYQDFAKRMGVSSPTLLWILYALNDGNRHTQKDISLDWDLPKSTVNTVVSELRNKGYVDLVPVKGTRREMTVELTENGKAFADELLSSIYQMENRVFAQLGPEDRKMIEYMNKMLALLKEES